MKTFKEYLIESGTFSDIEIWMMNENLKSELTEDEEKKVDEAEAFGVVKLNQAKKMVELAEKPFRLDIGAKNFMEAAWMHKRNGKYYFNYHTCEGTLPAVLAPLASLSLAAPAPPASLVSLVVWLDKCGD